MTHFDLAIIGTGSGNTILDERYVGMRVAICEQGIFGGTCLARHIGTKFLLPQQVQDVLGKFPWLVCR